MRDKASATVSVGLNVNNPDVMILSVVKSKKSSGSGGFPEMIHWQVIYRKHEAEDYPVLTWIHGNSIHKKPPDRGLFIG